MPRSTRQLAADIKRYCDAYPEARDTIAGIRWWVQLQNREDSRSVSAAVQMLVREGVLERHAALDGHELYCRVQR